MEALAQVAVFLPLREFVLRAKTALFERFLRVRGFWERF